MAKLVMIVELPDVDSTTVDPHEAAADLLYPYEEHRSVNQNEPEMRFVEAMWGDFAQPMKLDFEATEPETYATQLGISGMSQGKLDDMMAELERERDQEDDDADAAGYERGDW